MTGRAKVGLAMLLVATLVGGILVAVRAGWETTGRLHVVAYFDNSNGVFPGDEVRILGVPVGAIETIEPQPQRAKITFWVDDQYMVPAGVNAMIISPQLVTARAIQLTPAYTGGPTLANGAVIAEDHTAVPVEWDDFRRQLKKLTESLQPTQPGGVSTLGAFIDTAADNLRGEGSNIRDTVIKLSQAFSVLGDHSGDIFGTFKNLSILVSALNSSSDLMRQLNTNLAAMSGLITNSPNEVGQAVYDLNTATADVNSFLADNRDTLGTTFDKLASITQALNDSRDDIKQALHVLPNTAQGLANTYQPAQAALSGVMAINNFANPIQFLCGAIQAASRKGAEQSAKLCAQYLAPIVKNRQYNFLPFGQNFLVGAQARPNEVTYSEDWMRPDHVPAPPPASPPPTSGDPPSGTQPPLAIPPTGPPLPAEAAVSTNPAEGLPGLMVPTGGGR